MKDELTRGGRKLEAAVARFGLAPRVRGGHAVDVGASTGGFVAVLLRCGARRVTAVDVGHGQLDPGLAADARVENLERTDWKTLSLNQAPGPYDFFSVDVSFVAARNMLRGLAFRLREGAEGVVLVKPQFELPSHLVRDGRVDDPALRARALAAFSKKAESLGFTVLAHMDSPVPGGSGTIEILAHLRFSGRPASMPQPGEKRPAREPVADTRAAKDLGHKTHLWFAAATPGLEDALAKEVERLPGASEARAIPGGVEFRGKLETGMAANLYLRIASRVVLRLGQVKARDFAPLRRKLADLPWKQFLPKDRPLRIDVSTSHCRLYHTKALAETVELAVGDRVGGGGLSPPKPERGKEREAGREAPGRERWRCGAEVPEGEKPSQGLHQDDRVGGGGLNPPKPERGKVWKPSQGFHHDDEDNGDLSRVLVRGENDQFTISVDSSGELLHRRGWRLETGRAPLRETLAAGILRLCDYDPSLPFFDPMCGSGTIALEACALALGKAPGLHRSFAFERWPCLDAQAWTNLRARAEAAQVTAPPALIVGADRNPAAIDIARRNAERAGFAPHLQFNVATFGSGPAPAPAGLMVINPPYGRRLGERGQVSRLGRDIGRILHAQYPGWRIGVLGMDAAFGQALTAGLRRPVKATHALRNGGLRVTLLIFESVARALAG